MSQVPLELYPYYWRLVLYGAVCSVILMGSSHHGYAVFFLHGLWYNYINKSTRPLEEAQEGGYLPASPVLYLGMKKAVVR